MVKSRKLKFEYANKILILKADLTDLSTESLVFMKTRNIFDCHEATERVILVEQCKILKLINFSWSLELNYST